MNEHVMLGILACINVSYINAANTDPTKWVRLMFIIGILSVYPVIQYMEGDISSCCLIVLISLDLVLIIMTRCILLIMLIVLFIKI